MHIDIAGHQQAPLARASLQKASCRLTYCEPWTGIRERVQQVLTSGKALRERR